MLRLFAAVRVSDTGLLGLRGRHTVWSLPSPPRISEVHRLIETCETCPHLADFLDAHFGRHCLCREGLPFSGAGLCLRKSRSWTPISDGEGPAYAPMMIVPCNNPERSVDRS